MARRGYLGLGGEGGLFGGGYGSRRYGGGGSLGLGDESGSLFGSSGLDRLQGLDRSSKPSSAGPRFGEQDLRQNPILSQLLSQVLANLNPQKQRRQVRRQFTNYGSALGRGYDQALNQTRQGLAGRGLGSSGYGAALELGNRQGLAQQMAALPGQYHQALQEEQQRARQEALQQVLAFLGLQAQQEQFNFARKQLKEGRPSQFQKTIGDIGSVVDIVGSLIGGISGIPGIGGGGGGGDRWAHMRGEYP